MLLCKEKTKMTNKHTEYEEFDDQSEVKAGYSIAGLLFDVALLAVGAFAGGLFGFCAIFFAMLIGKLIASNMETQQKLDELSERLK